MDSYREVDSQSTSLFHCGELSCCAVMAPAKGVDTSEGRKVRAPGVDTSTSGVRGYFDRLLIGVWCCAGRGRVDLLGVERPEPE